MIHKAGIQHLAKHLNASSQIVLRADFNVPIKDSKISDPNRINATVPTIQQLLRHNPKSLVMLSHLGRPNGQKVAKLSLKPIADHLSSVLNRKVTFLDDCVGESTLDAISKANNEVFLCENVRFHQEEEGSKKDKDGKKIKATPQSISKFRNQLSKLGNLYVNDAFGAAHRAHSSVVGIAHKYRVAGLLMEKQFKFMGEFLTNPKKPVLVVLGGAKVADKIELIESMLNLADQIIIGGGMRFPFFKEVYGYKLGATRVHLPEKPQKLKQIIEKANKKGVKIHFPVDSVIAKEMKEGAQTKICTNQQGIPDGWQAFDCGPQSMVKFGEVISRAKSIFWNGPMGVFELGPFKNGSETVLKQIVAQTKKGATSIIGGGDSASLINNLHLEKEVTFVSTGGGATLELLEGKALPGITNLSQIKDLQ